MPTTIEWSHMREGQAVRLIHQTEFGLSQSGGVVMALEDEKVQLRNSRTGRTCWVGRAGLVRVELAGAKG